MTLLLLLLQLELVAVRLLHAAAAAVRDASHRASRKR